MNGVGKVRHPTTQVFRLRKHHEDLVLRKVEAGVTKIGIQSFMQPGAAEQVRAPDALLLSVQPPRTAGARHMPHRTDRNFTFQGFRRRREQPSSAAWFLQSAWETGTELADSLLGVGRSPGVKGRHGAL